MGFIYEQRASDSPYVETITYGRTASDGCVIRPAEIHWHMVLVKHNDDRLALVVGPWSSAGVVSFTAGAELVWIKFRLGTFMPHRPTKDFRDRETVLPAPTPTTFWLSGSAWQFPDFENADTFVDRLAHKGVLVRDPLVAAAVQDEAREVPSRTLRHRFVRATGVTQSHIRQWERAQQAAALLRQGVSIADSMFEAGYYDQPHLTRSLKQFVGHTPAQLARAYSAIRHDPAVNRSRP